MSQDLSIENHKSGLERDYEKRRVNSFELGKNAIDSPLRWAKKLPYTIYLKRQKNSMNKVKGFILILLEIMKTSMRIIKKRVRVIRENKRARKTSSLSGK